MSTPRKPKPRAEECCAVCECGRPAAMPVELQTNSMQRACERCRALEAAGDGQHFEARAAIPRNGNSPDLKRNAARLRDLRRRGWLSPTQCAEMNAACDAALARRGLTREPSVWAKGILHHPEAAASRIPHPASRIPAPGLN